MGRGSERRILITATRTSSLGGTIWQCHTDACNPVGCSLPLDAHFVHFGSWVGWGGGGGLWEEGGSVSDLPFVCRKFHLFCFDGQCNYLLLDGGAKVAPVGGSPS